MRFNEFKRLEVFYFSAFTSLFEKFRFEKSLNSLHLSGEGLGKGALKKRATQISGSFKNYVRIN
jgi:hypothetical protein